MGNETAVEVVMYRLKPETDRGAFLASSETLTEIVRGMKGYRDRELSESDDGQWLDVLHWDRMEDALQAADAIMATPEAQRFMEHVDPDSITMLHFRQVSVDR